MSRSSPTRALVSLGCACLALACKGPPPDQVRLELPELIVSGDPVHATVYARRNGSSTVTSETTDFSVTPADVASVGKDMNLVCKKSGDAQVTAELQGVRGSATVKCRLVERIEVGKLPLFDLAKPPVTLSVQPLGKSGPPLGDVPVTLSTDSPRVLAVSGTTLTPLAVGETTLSVSAGTKTQKLPVRVVRSVTAEALPLEGGHRIYFGLPEGKYEVDVELLVDRTVSIEWRGAPYCSYKGYGRSHVSTCVLQNKGGAVIDNPAYILTGGTSVSTTGISIREVP
jgi:hypothetical protein